MAIALNKNLSLFLLKCRFRVAHTGVELPYEVSVDGHVLTLVATDGYDVTPLLVDVILINPGETADFEISANETCGKYWVRACAMSASGKNQTKSPREVGAMRKRLDRT